MMLSAEIIRVSASFRKTSATWAARADTQAANLEAGLQEGLKAYATKQSSMFERMAQQCTNDSIEILTKAERFLQGCQEDGRLIEEISVDSSSMQTD